MAGTKRRRGGSPKKTAPKEPTLEPPLHQNAVNRLISQLFNLKKKESAMVVERLWKDETSVRFLSEDFQASRVSENENEMIRPDDEIGYVLLLAAQTLERLALNPSDNAIAMAWLAFSVAPLSCPPQQTDYLSTKAARHVAGRALLASTIAANRALVQLTANAKGKKSNHESTAMAILAAILALDTVAGSREDAAGGTTTRQVKQVWEVARASLQLHAETYWLDKEQNELDNCNVWDPKMEACWRYIHGVGRDDGSSSSSLTDLFAQAIDQYYLITDHSNVSSRWIAMALTMDGEPRWLETNIALLNGPWIEYWSCPVMNDMVNKEPPSATSTSLRSVRGRRTDENIERVTAYEVAGSVVSVMLVSRMLQLFRVVSKSADRKFNGNLHIYTNACWSSHSTAKKQDPRDTGAVLLYEILAVHRRCLDEMDVPVVNDVDAVENTVALGSYYPFVNDVLEHLSISVSSSPSLLLSHESQVQVRNLLDGLAVAFILQQHKKPSVIDARLIQYAILQLIKALSQCRSSHENTSWLSKKTYALPLEVPSLSAKIKVQRKKNAAKSTFAGIFPGDYGPPHRGDAKLALTLRAVSSVGSWDKRCSVFLSLLLNVIASLYDTRNLEYPTTLTRKASSVPARTKTPSPRSHLRSSRGGKRRKLESDEREHVASDQSLWYRMSGTRALVCSAALDALSLCLRFPHNDQNLSQLQKLLRLNMNSDHVLGIIRLENSLYGVLPSPAVDVHLTDEDGGHALVNFFTEGEKRLWSSHMNACLTLGRGRVSFHSDDKHMYLGSRRMEVLKEVCKTSIDVGGLLWPLWIPPSHRWIVASNLTSEEIQSNCLDAELFIVNGALMSIGEVLKSFATWSFREPSSEHTMVSSAYDEVLLSLDNARLILGAFSRLDKDNRRDSFAKLIEIVCPWIESISERPNDLIRLKDDFEASGFVSRVVTLCANAYSLMRFGSSVRRELVELIGSSQTSSALFVRRNRQYSAEKSFMGVLGNWEFSDDVSSRLLLQDVDPRAEESMKQILEAAFRLGFLSGQTDRGHLLFSAWNGLGKSDLWHIKNEVVPLPQGFVMEASNTPSVILELRDDLCLVSRLLRKLNFKASSVPPLIAAIDGRMKSEFRNKAELSLKIGQCLLAMISKASTLVEIVLDINDSASLSAAPPQIQCLLHTISTYVCFVASSCTRPKTDFFSNFSAIYHRSSHKRKRGNSTDSEASDSDEEATEVENDEALHLLKSLEDICSKIGASPAYPDWLDAECSLLDRINPDMALDIAEKAQKCLCSLVTVCVREIKALQNVVLSDQSSFSPAIDVPMPIVELCWVDQFWDVTPSVSGRRAHISAEDSGSLYDSVSRHLRIESDDLRFAAEILTTKVQDCQAMRWFKCASQRVQGKLSDLFRGNSLGEVDVSTPVLRAGCEWEMLLARGLTPACLGLDKVSRASTSARLPFLEALRWNDVLSGAVDCFVPVVALVHFGLHKGGRPICPLRSSEMHIDLLQRNYEYFKGSLFNVNASVSLKESVHETLAVLAILPLTRSLSASASQLCTSEDTFPRLRSFASLTKALNILGELQALTTVENHHEQDLLCRTIVDRLALIMENAKSDQQSSTYAISRETLLSAFSVMKFPKAKTILGVDFDTAFVTRVLRRTYYCSGSYTNHILKDEKFGSLRCLTSFIWSNTKLASCRSRILFVEMFYEVIRSLPEEDDDENGPLSPVLGILNNCEDDALRRLLVEDICFRPEKEDGNEPSRKLQGCLCSLFSIILCKGVRASRCKKSGVIAKTLLESIQIWWGEPRLARVQILNLLLLHSTVSRELHLVGRAFLASYEENKRPLSIDVEDLCYISNFVSSLQSSLTDKENETRGGQQDKVLALLPPVCTYIAYSDFHEQHWYQCLTCGLVGDRGCCSLCALVCHRGHDVLYARKSSFFCDCGAEHANDRDSTRLKCKCLKAIPKSEIGGFLVEQKPVNSFSKMNDWQDVATPACVERISSLYSKESKAALKLFLKKSGYKERSNELVTSLASELRSELDFSASATVQNRFDRGFQWTYPALRTALRDRECSSTVSDPVSFFEPPLLSFFVEDSLHVMLSSLNRSYLSENRIKRRVVQADSKGRLFIGEANSLLICNGFAACSFFFRQSREFAGFSRQSLGILKSLQVHFEVIGLQLAPGNERISAVWGSHDITVFVMKHALDDCEQKIHLSTNLDKAGPALGDILNCQWLHGSARYLVVCCRGMLLFYDIEALDRNPVARLRSPVDGDNSLEINDFISVPIRQSGSNKSWEVFVVLRDCTLHSTTLTFTCEPQQLILPVSQIPKGQGLQVSSTSLSESTLGKACRISFLAQSSLLIYQEDESYAHGLLINGDGKIDHSFPILPHRLCVKESGTVTAITGPYTHWCELGLISDESSPEPFFRVTCIAREESSDLRVLVSLDFNKETTNIKVAKIAQEVNSSVCLTEDVIGCAAISFPLVKRSMNQRAGRLEQTFLCMVTAKGSLISFADDCSTPLMLSVDPLVDKKGNLENRPELLIETEAPLLAFEKLTNISEHGHVFYHGGLMESPEETKTKLLRDNDGFVRSPEIDGFTLNITMETLVDRAESLRVGMDIVALRFLFGATDIDAIPQYICVQGSRVDIIPGQKRWYAVHLTEQEIVAGIRCGVISVYISRAFAGSTKAIIDCVELYGIERSSVGSWIPTSVESLVAFPHQTFQTAGHPDGTMTRPQRLRLILRGLSNCASTLASPASLVWDKAMLCGITSETFLHGDVEMGDSIKHLVASSGLPESERQNLMDDALISSCLGLLVKFQNGFIEQQQGDAEAHRNLWHIIRPTLRAYLRAVAAVARLRPGSYLRSVGSFSESIALKIRMLLDDEFLQFPDNCEFVSDFVELSLLECAIARNFGDDFDSREKFAGFGILSPILTCTNRLVVESAALGVLSFCKKYSVQEELSEEEADLFAAKSMKVFYGCDFCAVFPIKDVRYAFEDEDHPIDLCGPCYNDAENYARSQNFSESEDVVPGVAAKEDRPKLTCAEVKKLKPQIDTIENATGKVHAQVFRRRQVFGDFLDGLVSTIGNAIASEIEKHELLVSPLIALIDDISHLGEQNSSCDRAAWLARKLVEGVSRSLQRVPPQQLQPSERTSLLACVQKFALALSTLVVPDKGARDFLINPFNEDGSPSKLDKVSTTRFRCNHGIAATRRKLDGGRMSERSFYSCSIKSKAHKCNYFEWSDSSSMHRRPQYNENVARKIWEMISKPQSGRRSSIQELLCNFLKQLLSTIEASPHEVAKSAMEITRQESSKEILNDFNDGAFCSKSRIKDSLEVLSSVNGYQRQSLSSSMAQTGSILELIALVAEGGEGDMWFDPLCTILVSPHENTSSFRPLAKRCLFQLCGKSPALFLIVRDSYLFRSRFELLMNKCQDLIDYCLIVNKKAFQQKRRGQDEEDLEWKKLSLREIIDATDLMTEDASLRDCSSKFSAALEELLLHASKRPMNWKAFCQSTGSRPANSQYCDGHCYPLFEVIALPSLLVGQNRARSMKLASLAFATLSSPTDSHESSTVVLETTSAIGHENFGIQEDDIFAFIIRFVCSDESQDVRRLAMIVARGLCGGEREAARLFIRLLKRQASMIGRMGKLFVEFFALLNMLVRATRKEYIDVHSMLAAVEHFFCEQTLASHCDQLEGATYCFETRKNSAIQRTKFDLVPCGHIVSRPLSKTKMKRHPEQVGQFTRFRLKTGPDSASSNEFNHFLSLPHRSVISEIYVEINDPRGRFVKAINFYCSPRPVNSSLTLKEAEYLPFWKLCGRVTLERAAEKILMKLDDPVVASNLRIEFDEFYERPGCHKSDDFVVHCPRCMRVVTNAHGVCGSCGEVAFQCRKCRHINYERLNAYLCVECGYCASGGLSYEVTAAVATNAVAITCDDDYHEALSMFTSAFKIFEDLRAALGENLNALSLHHPPHHTRIPADGVSTSITRAFEGQLPLKPGSVESKLEMPSLELFDKRGSIVKAIAQKRKCPLDGIDNSTPQQPIARHSSGFDRDDFDDASEFFGGLLESSGMGRGLDRLMASVHRQRERNGSRDHAERYSRLHQCSPRNNGVAECDHLYQLVHEAQRECFRLERRIEAWQRLEAGSLIDDDQYSSPGFQPSRCSFCSPLVTRQLLMLWHSLFLLDPEVAQINEDMLAILLAEDVMSVKDVQEMKRKIVKDIAVKSKKGRLAILDALSRRRMIDRHCAEIIGDVLKEEDDAEIVNPFLSLADRVLDCDLAL